ncbi:MAG: hypothetical protein EBR40_00955 [Proteobacteria bacterium]|nr:hypothetical protein [Pseudomonadota bacterium]
MLLGPASERAPVERFLPGSRRTILYPATVDSYGSTRSARTPGKGGWDRVIAESLDRSALLLSTTDPLLVRDSKGVLQMAVLSADSPLLATAVLTKGFLTRFSALFGPELLITIPARNKVYVFPKLANRIPEMSGTIRDDYLISPMPVSTELFELSKSGLKTVGTIDPDER